MSDNPSSEHQAASQGDPIEPDWPLAQHDIFSQKPPGCGLNLTYLAPSRCNSIANNYKFNANGSRSHNDLVPEAYSSRSSVVNSNRPSLECFDPHYSFRKLTNPIRNEHTEVTNNNAIRDQEFKLPATLSSELSVSAPPQVLQETDQNEERYKYLSTLYSVGYSDLQDTKKNNYGMDTTKKWFGSRRKDNPSAALKDVERADDMMPQKLSRAYFIIGIFFPPFWIIGSIYNPASDTKPSGNEQRVDTRWRRRSRICLFCFVILSILLALALTLHPTVIGWKEIEKVDVKRTIADSGPLYHSIITPVL